MKCLVSSLNSLSSTSQKKSPLAIVFDSPMSFPWHLRNNVGNWEINSVIELTKDYFSSPWIMRETFEITQRRRNETEEHCFLDQFVIHNLLFSDITFIQGVHLFVFHRQLPTWGENTLWGKSCILVLISEVHNRKKRHLRKGERQKIWLKISLYFLVYYNNYPNLWPGTFILCFFPVLSNACLWLVFIPYSLFFPPPPFFSGITLQEATPQHHPFIMCRAIPLMSSRCNANIPVKMITMPLDQEQSVLMKGYGKSVL